MAKQTLNDWYLNFVDGPVLDIELTDGSTRTVPISSYDFEQLDQMAARGIPAGKRLSNILRDEDIDVPEVFWDC